METAVMVFCIVIVFTAGFFIMRRVDRMMDRERNTEKYGSNGTGTDEEAETESEEAGTAE